MSLQRQIESGARRTEKQLDTVDDIMERCSRQVASHDEPPL
jgi:hypothetical protein